ncbi:MAG: phosphoribosylanthranilate isomerase [Xanthomonadales bacterium PRO7]|nr:phosphoribosylanthranilate isomerase [Xanthomonadales bacterium PRO7]
MHRTRIKFCGITRAEDALAAVALGVDAIGLVLTRKSPRSIAPLQAREIRRTLPPFVTTVALLMDDEPGFIADAIATVQPDLLQFHGRETQDECLRFEMPYLKAIAMNGDNAPAQMHEHTAAVGFVFDAHAPGGQGGSGRVFDWSRIPRDLMRPLILAGGLNLANVAEAIATVAPYAMDVSSGIEAAPGIKDAARMRAFVDAVRAADAARG